MTSFIGKEYGHNSCFSGKSEVRKRRDQRKQGKGMNSDSFSVHFKQPNISFISTQTPEYVHNRIKLFPCYWPEKIHLATVLKSDLAGSVRKVSSVAPLFINDTSMYLTWPISFSNAICTVIGSEASSNWPKKRFCACCGQFKENVSSVDSRGEKLIMYTYYKVMFRKLYGSG